jgi:hypothetical protein
MLSDGRRDTRGMGHPLKCADRSDAEWAAHKKRQAVSEVHETSLLYIKLILLLGTLFIAYSLFRPHL